MPEGGDRLSILKAINTIAPICTEDHKLRSSRYLAVREQLPLLTQIHLTSIRDDNVAINDNTHNHPIPESVR